ncbi:Hypothetical predicted protein, partial [Marmota monax]
KCIKIKHFHLKYPPCTYHNVLVNMESPQVEDRYTENLREQTPIELYVVVIHRVQKMLEELLEKQWEILYFQSESYISTISISTDNIGMTEGNHSMTTEFILMGFMDHPDMKTLLFVVFSAIYLVTMMGNLGLVALIYMERRLHTPMYIFLGNLALMDSCCSCAITPKMLQNFFSEDKRISLYECMIQFYSLCLAETTDCFLLAAMAYDRYVAICRPLQYHTMMSMELCIQMTTGAYI